MDIIKEGQGFEGGFSITTADDGIRKLFEPAAPSINDRIKALEELHKAGIRAYAMIAPLLTGAEGAAAAGGVRAGMPERDEQGCSSAGAAREGDGSCCSGRAGQIPPSAP